MVLMKYNITVTGKPRGYGAPKFKPIGRYSLTEALVASRNQKGNQT